MTTEHLNAWGESVPQDEDPEDLYYVPPEERVDVDSGPASDALGADDHGIDTGDDLDGWKPGDPA